jgi:hypothetical protein
MDTVIKPQNFAERVIWYTIILTYPLYFLGLIFPVNATLPWLLLINVGTRAWNQSDRTPVDKRVHIPMIVWLWLCSAVIVLIAMLIGLTEFNYDIRQFIRSTFQWGWGWALFPICFTLGSCLQIRPQIIYRAVCNLCGQSIFMIGVGILAFATKIPDVLYISPLGQVLQNGPYYAVRLYMLEVDSGSRVLRFCLFAPWAPALGFAACIYFLLALQESNKFWKGLGLVGATVMISASVARGAFVSLPVVLLSVWAWGTWNRAYLQLVVGFLIFWICLFSFTASQAFEGAIDTFVSARKGSSELRATLQRVALDRWIEAPIWGHGKQVVGPKVLKSMPLGSHHTWFGLLFSHGIVGFIAIFISSVATLIVLAMKAQANRADRVALGIMLLLLLTSMGENIDGLVYLVWPALVLVGQSLSLRTDS